MLLLSCDDLPWPDFLGFDKAMNALQISKAPMDAVSARICAVENAELRSVGVTGDPDAEGTVSLEAGVMSGRNLLSAGVSALVGYQSPFLVAKEIWQRQLSGDLKNNLFTGVGAGKLAQSFGAEKARPLPPSLLEKEAITHDTVGCIGWDGDMDWAVGTSSSGAGGKLPGRVGDASECGAGFYAIQEGAVFCTWTGEVSNRLQPSIRVALAIKSGQSVGRAVASVLQEASTMQDGFVGPIIIYAATKEACSVAAYGFEGEVPATYSYWRDGMEKPQRQPVPLWRPGQESAPEF